MQKTALVYGAGGFIGHHMVKRLKAEGYWVRGIDLKKPEFSPTAADDFWVWDLTDPILVAESLRWAGTRIDGPYRDLN
jgi:GDP-D-mannose 3',5'-epimerase